MTRKNKIGISVIIGFFVVLALLLWLTIERPDGPTRGFDDNVLIQQRMDRER